MNTLEMDMFMDMHYYKRLPRKLKKKMKKDHEKTIILITKHIKKVQDGTI